MSMPAPPPEMETVGTQTVGLFFKSTKGLALEEKVKEDRKALQENMSDKKPVLTAISPGKGTSCITTQRIHKACVINCYAQLHMV